MLKKLEEFHVKGMDVEDHLKSVNGIRLKKPQLKMAKATCKKKWMGKMPILSGQSVGKIIDCL